MGIMQFNKNATERAKEDIKGVLKALNDYLLAKTFLVGESISPIINIFSHHITCKGSRVCFTFEDHVQIG